MVTADYTLRLSRRQPPSTANPADLPVVERSELARVLDLADHEPLFDALRQHNRTGRPPYDVRAMWRATLSKYLLGIDYNVELVAQLRSDAFLRDACGFEDDSTPNESVVCRFYKRLTSHQDLVDDAVHILVDRLAEAIDECRKPDDPKPGHVMAIDSTDIETFADVRLKPSTDPDAKWGHRTPKNAVNKAEDNGKKDEFFFGFKMHAVCDANWGFPLGWIMLPANRSDSPTLPGLVDQVITQHPHLKPEYFIGDRGYDAYTNYRHLEDNRIWAVIHMRDARKAGDPIYTTSGEPLCLSGKPMEYIRTDQGKGHLFRCPDGGCERKGKVIAGAVEMCDGEHYENPVGDAELLRKVGRLARASKKWKRLYAKRTGIERLFGSLKRSRLLDTHRYRGMVKVGLHAMLGGLTYLATMLGKVLDGDLEGMRRMRLSTRPEK